MLCQTELMMGKDWDPQAFCFRGATTGRLISVNSHIIGLAATAWLCSELNAHRIVHRFAEQRLPRPGRIACPFDMHVATALTLRFATVRKLVSSRRDN